MGLWKIDLWILCTVCLKERYKRAAEPSAAHQGQVHHNIYAPLEEDPQDYHNRQKREASTKRTCTLFMQSDAELWRYMTRSTDENGLQYVSTIWYRKKNDKDSLLQVNVD